MRKLFLLSILIIMPFLLFSQKAITKSDTTSSTRIYLDGSVGFAFPLGDYSKKDLKNDNSGFASQGFMGQINLDWIGKQDYGLGLQYTFESNPLSSSVKNDTLTGMGKALGNSAWINHYLMAGLVVIKHFQKIYFEGKALVGIIISTSPIFNSTDPATKISSSNAGVGLAYGAQVGIGYAVSPRVTVKANVEYLAGTPKIHHTYGAEVIGVDTSGRFIYSPPIDVETKRTVSSLFIKAGIVVKLSK
jgi:hypothetical protein